MVTIVDQLTVDFEACKLFFGSKKILIMPNFIFIPVIAKQWVVPAGAYFRLVITLTVNKIGLRENRWAEK